MRISELVKHLEDFKRDHGDLRCVTPGFDESNLDLVREICLQWVDPKARIHSISGAYERVCQDTPGSEKVLEINF